MERPELVIWQCNAPSVWCRRGRIRKAAVTVTCWRHWSSTAKRKCRRRLIPHCRKWSSSAWVTRQTSTDRRSASGTRPCRCCRHHCCRPSSDGTRRGENFRGRASSCRTTSRSIARCSDGWVTPSPLPRASHVASPRRCDVQQLVVNAEN